MAASEANSPVDKEKAGPSPPKQRNASNVRRSIGEWEGNKGKDTKIAASATYLVSPKGRRTSAAPSGPTQRAALSHVGKETKRRGSVEAAGGSPGPVASSDRVHEGRVWLLRAKAHLNDSRNLRADLKAGLIQAVESLFRLIKDGAAEALDMAKSQTLCLSEKGRKDEQGTKTGNELSDDAARLTRTIEEHSKLMQESNKQMQELKSVLEEQKAAKKEIPSYAEVTQVWSSSGRLQKRNTTHNRIGTR
ncbi:hypothetical protein PYW07_016820 [Mythimna separata]|uniref:Uncharacterized protein n=1 Tax=Mythimna separata TaxID=271217 RepID=A0AAD7YMC8_MYTSE|nr:hypothetical protein PYW07_016820 [Mythimna separata]